MNWAFRNVRSILRIINSIDSSRLIISDLFACVEQIFASLVNLIKQLEPKLGSLNLYWKMAVRGGVIDCWKHLSLSVQSCPSLKREIAYNPKRIKLKLNTERGPR